MITFAPSPSWKDLLKLFLPIKISEEKLAKPWQRAGDEVVWFSRTAWSLYAIILWWEQCFEKKHPCVWVPSYFCNQALWPLRQSSAHIIFYPIKEKLLPDWEACEALAREHKPDVFILTHYYGIISESKKAKLFCEQFQALFIEDAAHFFVPVPGVGESCHVSLYSPHKMFAIPHGAICLIRPSFEKYRQALGGKKIALDAVRDAIGSRSPAYGTWFVKRIIQKLTFNQLARFKKVIAYEEDGTSFPMPMRPQMHKMAKKLLSFSVDKIPAYVQHRYDCALVWDYLITQNNLEMRRLNSNESGIPYVAVYSVERGNASEVYYKLSAKKWPVSSWPDLPPEVRQNEEFFHKTIAFRNNMLVFPTHQSLSPMALIAWYGKMQSNSDCFLQEISYVDWEKYFAQVKRSYLLQSWAYGETKAAVEKWSVTRFLIVNKDIPIALLQVCYKKIGFFTVVRINHGPVWLHENIVLEDVRAALQTIRQHFSYKKACVLFFAPNLTDGIVHRLLLAQAGYFLRSTQKIGTIWLDLRQSEAELRAAFRSNWRRSLGASEKKALHYKTLELQEGLPWLLQKVAEFQKQKDFKGISLPIVRHLISAHSDVLSSTIFQATFDETPVAGVLIVRHGLSCTYLLVWADQLSRDLDATNFLLWNAILEMKRAGCLAMDLGGISEANRALAAITAFKRGLGGEEIWFAGEYMSL